MNKTGRTPLMLTWTATIVLLVAGAVAAILFGAGMGAGESLRTLLGGDATATLIVLRIRLPRIALALLVGGALSISGGTMQGMFRNPLADPHILGVASGASFGATLAMALSLHQTPFGLGPVTLFAFVGAIATIFVVYGLSRVTGLMSSSGLLLAGVALGSILTAATTFLMSVNRDKMETMLYWTMGSLSTAGWGEVLWCLPLVLVGSVGMALHSRPLNLIALGEEEAQHLGVDVNRLRLRLMVFSAIATAGAVSAAGVIGFVGLVIPHILRMLVGPDHRRLLPLALVAGGAFLLVMDTLARNLLAPLELPVGILTSLVGAPFFIWLLLRKGVR